MNIVTLKEGNKNSGFYKKAGHKGIPGVQGGSQRVGGITLLPVKIYQSGDITQNGDDMLDKGLADIGRNYNPTDDPNHKKIELGDITWSQCKDDIVGVDMRSAVKNDIVATARTGFGCLPEGEHVITGNIPEFQGIYQEH